MTGSQLSARGYPSVHPNDFRAVDTAASKIQVEGARYPGELEKRTGL